MPDGVVQWFDPSTGEAAIVRGGRTFRAQASDVEPVARRPGVRVHFDIQRDNGVERAVDVEPRRGRRSWNRRRRVGSLAGARRPDTKGPSAYENVHPTISRSAESRPLEVAHVWMSCVADGDVDGAWSLYAPDAVLHVGEDTVTGGVALRAVLEASPVFGSGRAAAVRGAGDGDGITTTWDAVDPDALGWEVRSRIEHGHVVEQWVRGRSADEQVAGRVEAPLDVEVSAAGKVGEDDKSYAIEKVRMLADVVDEPFLLARIRLTYEPDPARDRPAVIQAVLDVNGDLVRAHVAARTLRESADLLQRRLRAKLEHRAEHRKWVRHLPGIAEEGEWRHIDLPSERPEHFPRPVEERQLIRHKSFATDELTPDEAIFDMGQLDYGFYLFTDLATGTDSIVERLADGATRLTRVDADTADPGPTASRVLVSDVPVPTLTVEEAVGRLNVSGEPFVFFADAATDRGNVVYLRYDGHYGLITPE